MTKKTIYVIEEYSGYYDDGCLIGGSCEIEAFEFEQDAILALWYWYCDQIEKSFNTVWDGDRQEARSEGDGMDDILNRYIVKLNLWA